MGRERVNAQLTLLFLLSVPHRKDLDRQAGRPIGFRVVSNDFHFGWEEILCVIKFERLYKGPS